MSVSGQSMEHNINTMFKKNKWMKNEHTKN